MVFHVNPLPRQRIHMKYHTLFFQKIKVKKKKNIVSSAAILLGTLSTGINKTDGQMTDTDW